MMEFLHKLEILAFIRKELLRRKAFRFFRLKELYLKYKDDYFDPSLEEQTKLDIVDEINHLKLRTKNHYNALMVYGFLFFIYNMISVSVISHALLGWYFFRIFSYIFGLMLIIIAYMLYVHRHKEHYDLNAKIIGISFILINLIQLICMVSFVCVNDGSTIILTDYRITTRFFYHEISYPNDVILGKIPNVSAILSILVFIFTMYVWIKDFKEMKKETPKLYFKRLISNYKLPIQKVKIIERKLSTCEEFEREDVAYETRKVLANSNIYSTWLIGWAIILVINAFYVILMAYGGRGAIFTFNLMFTIGLPVLLLLALIFYNRTTVCEIIGLIFYYPFILDNWNGAYSLYMASPYDFRMYYSFPGIFYGEFYEGSKVMDTYYHVEYFGIISLVFVGVGLFLYLNEQRIIKTFDNDILSLKNSY